jgi:predicted transcriptional regulator
MGTLKPKKLRLGDVLFSKTQQRVLGLLFGNPDRSYYAKEIVRFAGVGIGSVYRELEKLTAVGLITMKKTGHHKYYQANRESLIFEELAVILHKVSGSGKADIAETGNSNH